MSLSLYEAFVPNCQQVVGALANLIDKGEAFAKDKGISDEDMIGARLAEDMWNLPWHVRSCWVHSAYVISLLPSGEFSPDFTQVPDSWDAMRAQVAATLDGLATATVRESRDWRREDLCPQAYLERSFRTRPHCGHCSNPSAQPFRKEISRSGHRQHG
ncbi:MAG: DUF1993 family protein [Sphingomonadales bacterium]|nr:DUF1993 family protein [Sphingomonadales bacterium]